MFAAECIQADDTTVTVPAEGTIRIGRVWLICGQRNEVFSSR
jgi:hypothetical protein